jgi:histidinol phosphatase-like PHP family hydrolase
MKSAVSGKKPRSEIRAGIELITIQFTQRPAENGSSNIGTSSILSWARFISSIAPIKCSTACRPARNNSRAAIDAIYADYFRRVREIAATGLVDCLAHLDLIKIHGHRPNTEIDAIVNETLDLIRSRNLAVELSTAGWRKPVNELYPADRIVELCMEKRIPFTTASDAHSHAQLGDHFPRLAEKMSIFGIREVCVFEKHKRKMGVVCAISS